LYIVRQVLVQLTDTIFDEIPIWTEAHAKGWTYILGNQVREKDGLYVMIASLVKLNGYPKTKDKFIQFPMGAIGVAESAIEKEASVLSIKAMSPRKLYSPTNYLQIVYESEEELQWLNDTNGYQFSGAPTARMPINIRGTHDVDPQFLTDREDGVLLLSESISHTNYMGKYREYMRFFERAFSCPISKLEKKLYQFLSGFEGAGFTRDEVKKWLSYRNSASHAVQDVFLIERNVIPVVERIQQAAYDVLYNKARWRSHCKERRDVFYPSCFSSSSDGARCVVAAENAIFAATSFDEFGSYERKGNSGELSLDRGLKVWDRSVNRPWG